MGDVTIITPASRYDLALAEWIQEELGLDYGTDGRVFARLIKGASAAVQRYCRRGFAEERVTETFGHDEIHRTLFLSRTPVATVHEVTNGAGAVIDPANYRLENAVQGRMRFGLVTPFRDRPWISSIGFPAVSVEYTGGYILPGMDGRTLPDDIERATMAIVKAWYSQKDWDSTKISETLGDYSVRYADLSETGQGIPIEAQALLDGYRRMAVA